MEGLRRVLILAVVAAAILLSARLLQNGEEPPPAPPRPPALVFQGDWGHVDFRGFRLFLPRGWKHARSTPSGEVFAGPEDDGFAPNVHLYTFRRSTTLDQWFRHQRLKYESPVSGATIRGEGRDTVAGMPARFLVYEYKTETRDGRLLLTTTKDWYFVGHGHAGILRGISTARTYLQPYKALFNEVKRRLRDLAR